MLNSFTCENAQTTVVVIGGFVHLLEQTGFQFCWGWAWDVGVSGEDDLFYFLFLVFSIILLF